MKTVGLLKLSVGEILLIKSSGENHLFTELYLMMGPWKKLPLSCNFGFKPPVDGSSLLD